MNDLLQIFSRDINMYSDLISDNLFVESFLVTEMNVKTESIFISNRAIETMMKNLLIQYFTSQDSTTSI